MDQLHFWNIYLNVITKVANGVVNKHSQNIHSEWDSPMFSSNKNFYKTK